LPKSEILTLAGILASRSTQLDAAFAALGKRLVLSLENAA
jgi:hypothetical protein